MTVGLVIQSLSKGRPQNLFLRTVKVYRLKLNPCFLYNSYSTRTVTPQMCLLIGIRVNFTSKHCGRNSTIVNLFTCEIDSVVVLCCHNREECRYSLHARVSKATAMIHWSIQQIGVPIGWQSNWRESAKFCVSVQTLDDKHVIVCRKSRNSANSSCYFYLYELFLKKNNKTSLLSSFQFPFSLFIYFFFLLITVLFTLIFREVRTDLFTATKNNCEYVDIPQLSLISYILILVKVISS